MALTKDATSVFFRLLICLWFITPACAAKDRIGAVLASAFLSILSSFLVANFICTIFFSCPKFHIRLEELLVLFCLEEVTLVK